jgi:hypothetical protein
MKRALLLAIVVLAGSIAAPASGRAPALNVGTLCRVRAADARIAQLSEGRNATDCVNEEKDARQQLDGIWDATKASIRKQCESDAIELGTRNYVDLLACIEIAEDTKSVATGGSRDQTAQTSPHRHSGTRHSTRARNP